MLDDLEERVDPNGGLQLPELLHEAACKQLRMEEFMYLAAKQFLDRHGERAEVEAERLRDCCQHNRMLTGVVFWASIIAALADLRDVETKGNVH